MSNEVRIFRGLKSKIEPLVDEGIYFSTDTHELIISDGSIKFSVSDIEILNNDSDRTSLLAPLNKFYYVKDTNALWYYNGSWSQLNRGTDTLVTDWNNAKESGFYHSATGALNGPITDVSLSGNVIKSGNLIIQQIYPEDTSKEELVYYLRKGFVADSLVTWTKWFITKLSLEEYTI